MLLLDTNVLLELRKIRTGRAQQPVIAWEAGVDASELYISVATIQEIEFGILKVEKTDPVHASVLRTWFSIVLSTFRDRILIVDTAIAQRCAYLQTLRSRDFLDTVIAATAYVHNIPVVTRNVSDFADTDVRIINPWEL
jgi:toxin FitB